jgi:maltose O-acetyltransferase
MNLLRKTINFVRARLRKWITEERWLDDYIALGMRVGRDCAIQPGLVVDVSHCWLIDIGDRVTIAPQVYLLAHDASTKRHTGYARTSRVTIGDDAFIGARAVIMPGVSIGEGAIVGAGSVVVQSIPAGVVVAGNPARVICTVEEYMTRMESELTSAPRFSASYTLGGGITAEMKDEMREQLTSKTGFVE